MRLSWPPVGVALTLVAAAAVAGCDAAHTNVVIDNGYPPVAPSPFVVYRAWWQAVAFPAPIPPGTSSDPQPTVAASANRAYVVVAPGWDPMSPMSPTALIVLQSLDGFAVRLDQTLHIPVDDTTFAGNCAAGSPLTQDQADFIIGRVFAAADLGMLTYDAATCTVTSSGTP